MERTFEEDNMLGEIGVAAVPPEWKPCELVPRSKRSECQNVSKRLCTAQRANTPNQVNYPVPLLSHQLMSG